MHEMRFCPTFGRFNRVGKASVCPGEDVVHPLDPVTDGCPGARLQMGKAADVGRQDDLGLLGLQMTQLAIAQLA